MASSFPLSIATRAATQRNNACSVGATISNPVEIIDCSSDLDSVASDSPHFKPVPHIAVIKLEPGTTAVSAQEVNQGKAPHHLSDKDLTDYLEDPEPPLSRETHDNELQTLSATEVPPTAGGSNTAPECTSIKTSDESTPALDQVPLPIEPIPTPKSYAQIVHSGGKAPLSPPSPGGIPGTNLPPILGTTQDSSSMEVDEGANHSSNNSGALHALVDFLKGPSPRKTRFRSKTLAATPAALNTLRQCPLPPPRLLYPHSQWDPTPLAPP